jgi:hypothetical protein
VNYIFRSIFILFNQHLKEKYNHNDIHQNKSRTDGLQHHNQILITILKLEDNIAFLH